MSQLSEQRHALFGSEAHARLAHPHGFDRGLALGDVVTMVSRALNCVDPRLVDHGLHVAAILDAMLQVDGSLATDERRAAYFVALLHDIGAYRTEEIDRLVAFETDDVWEHAFYGYLFFKELSPLAPYAEVVLYHHMPDRYFTEQDDARVRFLSQALQVADRVDVLLLEEPEADAACVAERFARSLPGQFSPRAVALFAEAQERFDVLGTLRADDVRSEHARAGVTLVGDARTNPFRFADDLPVAGEAASYLDMLVHVIDFRSRHTVTHTVTTAWVAYELGLRLTRDEDAAARIYCGALLHDLGKIGVPLGILEKPGKLSADEMAVMRTHVTLTEDILAGCVDEDVLHAAVRHHEKLDGSGYPRGLSAADLTPAERIIAVADVVSALVGTRSYKEAFPKQKVLELLSDQAERGLLDAEAVGVMERDYDQIMATVARASTPVAEAYRRVQEEYRWLIAQLERRIPE